MLTQGVNTTAPHLIRQSHDKKALGKSSPLTVSLQLILKG